jgi:tetratricopeptide (TPR) repeat protein
VRRDIPEFAVSLLRQAESLLEDNDEIRRAALLDLGDALRDSVSMQEALDAYERAITAARAAGDTRRAAHGFLGVLETKGFLGLEDEHVPDQDARVEDALRLFDRLSDHRGLAKGMAGEGIRLLDGRTVDRRGSGLPEGDRLCPAGR